MATRRSRRGPARLPRRLQPRKEPAQARSRALVDAIVEAGARLLAEQGWEALTLQAVAARAGVSPGSLYQYFPDKAALVAEVTERQSQRELAFHLERFAAITPDTSLEDTLRLMLRAVLDFQRQEAALFRATLDALQHLGRYQQLAARAREAAMGLRAVLELHADRLAVRDLDLATHVCANAIHSLTHDGVMPRPATVDDDTLLRELERLVLGYLLPRR
ncbi:MAG: TetR/AcrR family transcriptional regulator [Myxococcaceae bacterium]|nr:TetR/AcrR family transcriptional regulator [Myxococcaceae bacterium]